MPAHLSKDLRKEIDHFYNFEAKRSKAAVFKHFKSRKLSRATVYRLLKKYDENGSIDISPHFGKGIRKKNKTFVTKVKEIVAENPDINSRQIAQELKISKSHVYKIMKDELSLKGNKKRTMPAHKEELSLKSNKKKTMPAYTGELLLKANAKKTMPVHREKLSLKAKKKETMPAHKEKLSLEASKSKKKYVSAHVSKDLRQEIVKFYNFAAKRSKTAVFKHFKSQKLSKSTIYRLLKKYDEEGSIEISPNFGKGIRKKNKTFVTKVMEILAEKPDISSRQIAQELKISRSHVHKIIKEELS